MPPLLLAPFLAGLARLPPQFSLVCVGAGGRSARCRDPRTAMSSACSAPPWSRPSCVGAPAPQRPGHSFQSRPLLPVGRPLGPLQPRGNSRFQKDVAFREKPSFCSLSALLVRLQAFCAADAVSERTFCCHARIQARQDGARSLATHGSRLAVHNALSYSLASVMATTFICRFPMTHSDFDPRYVSQERSQSSDPFSAFSDAVILQIRTPPPRFQ